MTVYRTIKWVGRTHPTFLNEEDELKHIKGAGFELTLASSPSTTTFIPYHRIHEVETIVTPSNSSPTPTPTSLL